MSIALAVIDQIRTAAKERFEKQLGVVSPQESISIEQALREVLDLP